MVTDTPNEYMASARPLPKLINKRFKLGDKIGSGSFGEIFAGCDIEDKKSVAIKLESFTARNPQLIYEAQIYNYLGAGEGIPRLYWYGREAGWNIMIIDFLGPSLEDVLNKNNNSLPIRFVLNLAQQMITRIEFLHEKLLLHRDVKPENFLLGSGTDSNLLYLIDFGLVKKYRDSNGRYIPYRESKGMTGTARYASICTHLGIEQARRDDLEGIAYVLIYLMKGQLPWQGLKATLKVDKYGKILRKKLNITVKSLCQGLPSCFCYLLSYCRMLRFQDRPDYNLLRKYFYEEWRQTVVGMNFDWNINPSLNLLNGMSSEHLMKTRPPVEKQMVRRTRREKRKLGKQASPASYEVNKYNSCNIDQSGSPQFDLSYASNIFKNLALFAGTTSPFVLFKPEEPNAYCENRSYMYVGNNSTSHQPDCHFNLRTPAH